MNSREEDIAAKIAPPAFILKHFREEFWGQIGAHLSPIDVPYPQYQFQYTSAGGNSGQTTTVELNTPTLEALSATLVNKIRWAKSAAGQRALMTTKLRGQIKERDNHTCLNCGVSLLAGQVGASLAGILAARVDQRNEPGKPDGAQNL